MISGPGPGGRRCRDRPKAGVHKHNSWGSYDRYSAADCWFRPGSHSGGPATRRARHLGDGCINAHGYFPVAGSLGDRERPVSKRASN